MRSFAFEPALQRLMTPEVMDAVAGIREYRGRQALYARVAPDALDQLCEVARIQSTGASNRIENISTSDTRLRELVEKRIEPHNRDEREIVGYRDVLDLIHQSSDGIPVSPGVILQLHRDLYGHLERSFAGHWKDSDNVIAERLPTGEMVTRFVPMPARATPEAVQRLCDAYKASIEARRYEPLLVAALFVFDFVSIHPFNDGNGRMSRLLTLLLLYKSRYTVGRYVSIEKEIEDTKGSYYDALKASSEGWLEGTNDYQPFVLYFLGVLTACYKELDRRVAILGESGSNEQMVRRVFGSLLGTITKREVMEAVPGMSRATADRILQRLQAEGVIERVGSARATAYRRCQ